MGYDTSFKGELKFSESLTERQLQHIQLYLGKDCRDYPEWKTKDLTNIDLKLSKDNKGIEWNGSQKTSNLDKKIKFIIDEMRKVIPNFIIKGNLLAQGENIEDRYLICVDEFDVYVENLK